MPWVQKVDGDVVNVLHGAPPFPADGPGWEWTDDVTAAAVASPSRMVDGATFTALFTATEVDALWALPGGFKQAALRVAAQNSANLASPELAQLLTLAVAQGVLTPQARTAILAGIPAAAR